MKKGRLRDALQAMVEDHGLERVEQLLLEIRKSTVRDLDGRSSAIRTIQEYKTSRSRLKRNKVTASAYVSKLTLPADTRELLEEMAKRYEEKTFLPSVGEIRNFCVIYGIDIPASPARASAIPRVFKFLAQLEAQDIQKIIQAHTFSGPSRLAPIADAIRRKSRLRAGRHSAKDRQSSTSAMDVTDARTDHSSKPPIPSKV